MRPFHFLFALICATLGYANPTLINTPGTQRPPQRLALPPPSPVGGLRPFQFPTDYNRTANYFNGTPEWWLYCSKTSEVVSPNYVNELLNGSFVRTTIQNGSIPNNTGWIWPYLLPEPSTQIYICNHNRLFNFSISVGVFSTINTWLDEICGEAIAGYVYLDTPWDVAIGRNSTTPNGDPKLECGGEWSPDSIWA